MKTKRRTRARSNPRTQKRLRLNELISDFVINERSNAIANRDKIEKNPIDFILAGNFRIVDRRSECNIGQFYKIKDNENGTEYIVKIYNVDDIFKKYPKFDIENIYKPKNEFGEGFFTYNLDTYADNQDRSDDLDDNTDQEINPPINLFNQSSYTDSNDESEESNDELDFWSKIDIEVKKSYVYIDELVNGKVLKNSIVEEISQKLHEIRSFLDDCIGIERQIIGLRSQIKHQYQSFSGYLADECKHLSLYQYIWGDNHVNSYHPCLILLKKSFDSIKDGLNSDFLLRFQRFLDELLPIFNRQSANSDNRSLTNGIFNLPISGKSSLHDFQSVDNKTLVRETSNFKLNYRFLAKNDFFPKVEAYSCRYLNAIKLRSGPGIFRLNTHLLDIFPYANHLQKLVLNGLGKIQGGWSRLFTSMRLCNELMYLDIESNSIEDDDIMPIVYLTNLVGLDISGNFVATKGMKAISNLLKLRKLTMRYQIRSYKDIEFYRSTPLKILSPLTNLTALSISDYYITNNDLKYIRHFSNLVHLNLSNHQVQGVKSDDMWNHLKYARKLETFIIDGNGMNCRELLKLRQRINANRSSR